MILLLLLFLILAPYLVGRPVGKLLDHTGHSIPDTYLYGVMTLFITSGGVQLLLILREGPFSDYEKWYPLILLLFALAGIVLTVLDLRKEKTEKSLRERLHSLSRSLLPDRESRIFGALTVAVLLLCGLRILTGTPDLTGDFTLETVNTTLATDRIYAYNSLTGQVIEAGMPIRQQILTMPFFLAFLSHVFRVDAAVLLYQIIPCYVLALAVLVYSRWGAILFPKQTGRQFGFLFVIGILLLAGDYARLAPAALILHQGFTGNALCAGVIIPFAICQCMRKKWLPAILCAGAELFLIWTTYGLGYCVWVVLLFVLVEFVGLVAGRRK